MSARSRPTSWPWSSVGACLLDRDGQLGTLLDERRQACVDVVDATPQPGEVAGHDGLGRDRRRGRLAQVLEPAQVVHQVAELGE